MKPIIKLLKKIVTKYDIKHAEHEEPIFICTSIDTRNRYKLDEWKRSEDQPQCPVYQDNRCCGGCKYVTECQHCVDCNCYGFRYAAVGGTSKDTYMRRASMHSIGRLDKDGKYDWDYYYLQKKIKEIVPDKFIVIEKRIYKVKSAANKNGSFSAISCTSNKLRKFNIKKLDNYPKIYDEQERAEFWTNISKEQEGE